MKDWCVFLPLLVLMGCAGPEPLRFSVQFDDSGALREGSPVIFRDVAIGRVIGVQESSGETVIHVEIDPPHRETLYREARFTVGEDSGGQPSLLIADHPGDRTAIEEGDVIDARPGWFERLSQGLNELGSSAQKALEGAKSGLQDAVTAFEDSPEFKAFKERLAEAGRDAATLARSRYSRFVQEDLPKLEEKALAYREKLEREGRSTEAEIFWKWFRRWADAVQQAESESEEPSPKPEREP